MSPLRASSSPLRASAQAAVPALAALPALAAAALSFAALIGAALTFTAPSAAGQVCCDPWTDLGNALSGTHGPPALDASGSLADDTEVTVSLEGALENAPAWLVVGTAQADLPFKGGVLVPAPDLLLGLPTDGNGLSGFTAPLPAGLPVGTQLLLQFWVQDAAGPTGFAASNAQLGVTPPPPPAGSFPADWVYGGNCATDPQVQIQQYDTNTWILRQSKCTNFEGPFMFLLFGQDKVLMLDSGAGSIPIYNTVQSVIASWLAAQGRTGPLPLVVAHTHSHGDHVAGDTQFTGKPNTTVVGKTTAAVSAFFGFQNWPNDQVTYDLGGRILDVLAIPGHQAQHIAVYDRETALLLTGDTLYPGYLFISGAVSQGNFAIYKASIQRLVNFIADKPVAWVFGNHVEMKNIPGQAYPYGTNNQPLERDPQLLREHLLELHQAVQAMTSPHTEVHDDFIISPSG